MSVIHPAQCNSYCQVSAILRPYNGVSWSCHQIFLLREKSFSPVPMTGSSTPLIERERATCSSDKPLFLPFNFFVFFLFDLSVCVSGPCYQPWEPSSGTMSGSRRLNLVAHFSIVKGISDVFKIEQQRDRD